MQVQGEEDKIEQLIFLMKQERFIEIDGVGSMELPLLEKENGFRVR